jgi:hypothetical protein
MPSFVPTLDQHHATNEEKVRALRKAFFPKPPHADLGDIPSAEYPERSELMNPRTHERNSAPEPPIIRQRRPSEEEIGQQLSRVDAGGRHDVRGYGDHLAGHVVHYEEFWLNSWINNHLYRNVFRRTQRPSLHVLSTGECPWTGTIRTPLQT